MSAPRPVLVFVLGAPRSGTSLLYRVLALHPDAAWVSGYVRRAPALPELAVLNRLAGAAPRTRARVWFGPAGDEAYRYGQSRSLGERLFPQPVEGEPLFARRRVLPGVAGHPAQARLRGDVRRLVRASGGRVLVSKRIDHNRRVPQLAALFPGARFVVLTRDGRAVARSLVRVDWWQDLELWWADGATVRDHLRRGADEDDLAARHWVAEVEAVHEGVAHVPARQVLHVAYEELVADPATVLDGVRAHAGLGEAATWERAVRELAFPDRNPARPPLDHGHPCQQPLLAHLGYT